MNITKEATEIRRRIDFTHERFNHYEQKEKEQKLKPMTIIWCEFIVREHDKKRQAARCWESELKFLKSIYYKCNTIYLRIKELKAALDILQNGVVIIK